MDRQTALQLKNALGLLRSGQNDNAREILVKVLKQDAACDQAWFLLSFAVAEEERKIYALQQALRINPGNVKAIEQLAVLLGVGNSSTQVVAAPTPPTQPSTSLNDQVELPRFTRRGLVQIRLEILRRRFRDSWHIFSRDFLAVFGLILIIWFAIMAVLHPILLNTVWARAIYDPVTGFDIKVLPNPSPPQKGHWLGTDALGRDVLSMLLDATTPTFIVGLTAAIVAATVGTTFSIVTAYFRGAVDFSITNLADVFLLFPAPLLMIIIGARFRDLGPWSLGLIYGLAIGASSTTIVMRAQALKIAAMPFMEAAKIAGGTPIQVMTRHLLPNMLPHAALQMMIAVSGAVVADGFISFFGFTRTTSNWGTMIYNGFVYSTLSAGPPAWHVLLPPAVAFTLFAMAFYLVSRGLQLIADPRLRDSR